MSPTATSVPTRQSCGHTCSDNGPEIDAASETAPIAASSTNATTASATGLGRAPSTHAASAPTGTQARIIRASGCRSSSASCSSGSAPGTLGPKPKIPARRSRSNQPIPSTTPTTTNAHAASGRKR